MVTAGLPAGQGDQTTFTAEQAGWYWLLCGVPGHAIEGEYLGLRVDPEAKTAASRSARSPSLPAPVLPEQPLDLPLEFPDQPLVLRARGRAVEARRAPGAPARRGRGRPWSGTT